jgi:hypothetical protein
MPAKSKQPKYGYRKCKECGVNVPLKIKKDFQNSKKE